VIREAPPRVAEKPARVVTILHVEDNKVVADALREALQSEGWKVESCADGAEARRKLAGGAQYDLLLLDNDLPGVSGLELAQLARRLPHRRRTPIIMLSAGDCETEAWRAGVQAFLRKPNDVLRVADVVARLVGQKN
jgi:two-component system chemotaxis response regulator CheY